MSQFSRNKLKLFLTVFLLVSGVFLYFGIWAAGPVLANWDPAVYNKPAFGTLTAAEWNNLFNDFVKRHATSTNDMTVPLTAPSFLGTLNAINVSAGAFGSLTGGGNYSFPGNVGIGTTASNAKLQIHSNTDNEDWLIFRGASGGTAKDFSIRQVRAGTNSDFAIVGPSGEFLRIWDHTNSGAISGNLRVGGSATPANALDVTGTATISGNLGIGTTTPASALDIRNGILTISRGQNAFVTNLSILSGSSPVSAFHISTDQPNLRSTVNARNNYILAFETNDVERMRINSSGNVGVGLTNPGTKLDVSGTLRASSAVTFSALGGSGTALVMTDDAGTLYADTSPVGSTILPSGTSGQTLRHDGSVWVANSNLFNSGANVGIGTTTPSSKLEVSGSSPLISLNDTESTSATYLNLKDNGVQKAFLGLINANAWGGISGSLDGDMFITTHSTNNPNGRIVLATGQNITKGIVINSTGNVGIGTTNPSALLDVRGGHLYVGSETFANPGSWASTINLDGSSHARILIEERSTGVQTALWAHTGGNAKVGTVSSHNFGIITGGTERVTINTVGNVGIGVTNPGTKLDVVGSLRNSSATTHSLLGGSGNVLVMADNTGTLYSSENPVGSVLLPAGTTGQTLHYSGGLWAANSNLFNNGTNVGIGTTAPGKKLEVVGDVKITGSGATLFLNANEGIMRGSSDGRISLMTALSERLTVSPSGNVGIGTTNPTQRLDVNGVIRGTSFQFGSNNDGSYGPNVIRNTGWSGLGITSVTNGDPYLNFNIDSTNVGDFYYSRTGGYFVINAPQLILNANGNNVGIGTTAPGTKLDVSGSLRNSGATTHSLIGGSGEVVVMSDNTGTLYGVASSTFMASLNKWTRGGDALANDSTWLGSTTNFDLPIITNNIERLRITKSGNVGIGTSAPGSLLTIANNSWLSAVNGAGTGYVNMFRVNANNQIEVGGPLMIGSFEFAPDSGLVTFVDMPVTSAPAAGTPQGYAIKIDGENLLGVYSEANGTGGIQNQRIGIGTMSPSINLSLFDSGLGLHRPAANTLAVWTDNAERMRVTAGGNVGIGTTNPLNALHVYKMWPDAGLRVGTGTGGDIAITSFNGAGGTITSNYNASSGAGETHIDATRAILMIDLHTGGVGDPDTFRLVRAPAGSDPPAWAELLRVVGSSGNVGIGVTNPGRKLDIGTGGTFRNDGATTHSLLGNSGNVVVMADNTGTLYTSPAGSSLLWSGTTGGNIWNANSGNVGIGTTNPSVKFQTTGNTILGDTRDSYVLVGNNQYSASSTSQFSPGYYVYRSANTLYGMKLQFDGANYSTAIFASNQANRSITFGRLDGVVSDSQFQERMRIDVNSGNVGIGTTSPAHALDVTGRIHATSHIRTESGSQIGIGAGNSVAFTTTGNTDFDNTGNLRISIDSNNNDADTTYFSIEKNGVAGSGTELFRVQETGNVGIGVTNPGRKLDIGTGGSFRNDGATTHSLLGNSGNVLVMADNTGTLYTATTSELFAANSGWTVNGTTVYKTNTNGNVGIGTTNPIKKLSINGSMNIFGEGGEQFLDLDSYNNGQFGGGIFIRHQRGTQASPSYPLLNDHLGTLGFGGIGNTVLLRAIAVENHSVTAKGTDLYFETTQAGTITRSEKMRITNTGNVGIGVTNPGNIKLDVAGAFRNSGATTHSLLGNSGNVLVMADNTGTLYTATTSELFAANSGWTVNGTTVYKTNTNGNVGIGTTNPGYKLDVNGDARFGGDDFIWNNEYKKQVANRVAGAANSRSEIRIPWPGTTSGPIILDVEVMIDTGSVSARHYVKKRFYLASYSGYVAGDLYSQSSYVVDSMDGNTDRYNYIDVFEEDTVNGRIVLPIYAGPTAGQNKSIVITAWGTKKVAAWIEGATFHSDVQVGITPPARAAVQAPPADNFVFSNNVGIGTTAPALKTEINGPIGYPATSGTSQTGVLRLSQPSTVVLDMGISGASPWGAWLQSTNKTNLSLTYPLLLNPNGGNVGIGTTNPGTSLDVGISVPTGSFRNAGATTHSMLGGSGNRFVMSDNTGTLYTSSIDGGMLPNGILGSTLYHNGSIWIASTTPIFNNGTNVGIGTTAPAQKFHVNGTARIDSTLYLNNNAHYISAGEFYVARTTAQGGFSFNNASVGELIFKTSNLERARISSNGKVGIGTSNPLKTLEVIGGVYPKNLSGANLIESASNLSDSSVWGGVTTVLTNFVDGSQIYALQSVSSGVAGTCYPWVNPSFSHSVKIDPNKKYEVSVWMRQSVGTSGSKYLGFTLYDANGNIISSAPYGNPYFFAASTSWSNWRRVNAYLDPAYVTDNNNDGMSDIQPAGKTVGTAWKFPANAAYVALRFGYCYSGTAGDTMLFAFPEIKEVSPLDSEYGSIFVRSSDNNIGIGLTNPGTKLDVAGAFRNSGATTHSLLGGSGNRFVMSDNTGTLYTSSIDGGMLPNGILGSTLYHNGSSWVASTTPIFNNGTNVGIGTTNPGAKLELSSGGGANSGINLKLTSAASYVPIDFNTPAGLGGQFVLTGASFSSGAFGGNELALASQLTSGVLHLASIGSSGIIKFTTGGNSVTNERMRVTSVGNVGIGTTAPTAKLAIQDGASAYSQISGEFNMALGIAADTALISGMDFKNFNTAGQVRFLARNNQNDYVVMNTFGSTAAGTIFGLNRVDTHAIFGIGNTDTDKKLAIGTFNSGDLVLGTANTERMRILSTGNVGIGITNPTRTLDVAGSGNFRNSGATTHSLIGGAGEVVVLADDTGTLYGVATSTFISVMSDNTKWTKGGDALANDSTSLGSTTNFDLPFITNNIEKMRITKGGNVGIGTSTPQSKLDIFQSGAINVVTPGQTRYGIHLTPQNATGNTATGITFGAGDTSAGQTAQAGIYAQFSGGYGTKMYFATTNSYATGAQTRMMIDHSGNVGIGVTNPGNIKLDVAGAFRNSGATTHSLLGGSGNRFVMNDNSGTLYNSTNLFDNGTNIGIGITNPVSKLHVNGGVSYKRTAVADINYTAQADDYIIGYTTITADRTVTLPNALCTPGRFFVVLDESGNAAANRRIIIDPEGATPIVGAANFFLRAPYNSVYVFCGNSAWYVL